MTLVQLEYLIAVDTYRSFVLAAEKCFVTQPTLSMQIQKLEDALGVRLFDRSHQPVVPTEMGKLIIAQARVVLRESKKIMELVQEQKGELAGELKLGIIPTIAPYLLPKVLGTFMEKYPQVQLQIWEYTTERIIRELKVGLLDCGILSTPVQDPQLYEKPLFYEPFVAYVSANGPLYQKKMIGTDDILLDKIWLLNEGHCMRGQALNICQRKQPVGDLLFEYNTGSVETLKRMVDVNAGSTILPELSISDFNEDQMERIRFFKSPEPVREISMVTMPNHLKSRAIEALEKEIQAGVPPRYLSSKKKEIIDYH
jgi:LysR family hydrogen peroxide-inducible transcriptional activator